MEEFWTLIFVSAFAINSLDKVEPVQLEGTPLNPFDEIFGEGWWANEKDEEWNKLTFEQNFHHQIDRQNTQIGQIEHNSTDQNPPLTESDPGQIDEIFGEGWWGNAKDEEWNKLTFEQNFHHQIDRQNTQIGQIEHNSTDQNPPLTESDPGQIDEIFGEGWWDNAKDEEWNKLTFEQNFHHQIDRQNTQIGQIEHNSSDQNPPYKVSSNENNDENERKRKIIYKFHAIRNEFKQKGEFSKKKWNQIEEKIAKHLTINRAKIYKWKKELDLSLRNPKNVRKNLVEKFDQMKAELKRDGFKNSYHQEIDETVAKELGFSLATIYRWKNELGQSKPKHMHSHREQNDLMKLYYEIKAKTPQTRDEDIAKSLNISRVTLCRWKKQFKPNSVDGQSVEENAAANVQEIGNSNWGSI